MAGSLETFPNFQPLGRFLSIKEFLKVGNKSFSISYYRYKNCFFNKKEAKDQAEATLLRLLKDEATAGPPSRRNTAQPDVQPEVQVLPVQGLAGILQQLRQQGCQERGVGEQDGTNREEFYLQKYLADELESVACLKYWEKQEREFGDHKIKGALCRLARFVFSFLSTKSI